MPISIKKSLNVGEITLLILKISKADHLKRTNEKSPMNINCCKPLGCHRVLNVFGRKLYPDTLALTVTQLPWSFLFYWANPRVNFSNSWDSCPPGSGRTTWIVGLTGAEKQKPEACQGVGTVFQCALVIEHIREFSRQICSFHGEVNSLKHSTNGPDSPLKWIFSPWILHYFPCSLRKC